MSTQGCGVGLDQQLGAAGQMLSWPCNMMPGEEDPGGLLERALSWSCHGGQVGAEMMPFVLWVSMSFTGSWCRGPPAADVSVPGSELTGAVMEPCALCKVSERRQEPLPGSLLSLSPIKTLLVALTPTPVPLI